jgi:phage terminase small subunit
MESPPPDLLGDEGCAEWERVRDVLGLRGDWRPKFFGMITLWCTSWEMLVAAVKEFTDSGGQLLLTDNRGETYWHPALQIAEEAADSLREIATGMLFSREIVERRIAAVMEPLAH